MSALVELKAIAGWHHPFAHLTDEDPASFTDVIAEAELLGVLALGASSSFGRALHAGDQNELSTQARRLLPRATATARLGSDLTAIVSGTPSASLAALLEATADRETRSTASVWRFSGTSIRRALDHGYTPSDLETELRQISGGSLPQPPTYLINDVARKHGTLRVAKAACVIHGGDPALIAEVAANRRLAKFGLRQLAPTVLVGKKSVAETLAALRAEGYAPVGEKADGTVELERTARQRATPAAWSDKPTRKPKARKIDFRALAKELKLAPTTTPVTPPLSEYEAQALVRLIGKV